MPRRNRRNRLPIALLAVCAAALIAALAPAGASASVITPTTTADVVADDADCSLREAITAANGNFNFHENACVAGGPNVADQIVLGAATYSIATSAVDDTNAAGDFDVNPAGGSVEIQGTGIGSTIVDGADMDRVFNVLLNSQNYASFDDLTIRNGNTAGSGAGVSAAADLFMTTGLGERRRRPGSAGGSGLQARLQAEEGQAQGQEAQDQVREDQEEEVMRCSSLFR